MSRRWVLVAAEFTTRGAMDTANLALARHLARTDAVHLVAHAVADDLAARPNVTVHPARRPFARILLGEPFLDRTGRRWARRLAGPDTTVVVNGGGCYWGDVNWVHCVHAAFPDPPPASRGGLKERVYHRYCVRAERTALRMSRLVLCNSQRTARDVVERLGVPPDRTRVIYLGIEAARFAAVSPADRTETRRRLGWADRPWVAFVGPVGRWIKGFDVLYAAWRRLCCDPRWDANLAVIGHDRCLSDWAARANADGLADRMNFLGHRADVPDVLAGCDVLAHPARYEAYGLGVHEALCAGLPALVTTAAGVAERYPPELAELLLSDPEDAAALADRLRHWRRNLEALRDRVRPFADRLRAHTWDDMAAAMRTVILE